MNANNYQIFEYVATLDNTRKLEKAVNDFLDKEGSSMNLLRRQMRVSQVVRENGENFPVVIRLEYLQRESVMDRRERVSMFICTYDKIQEKLLGICSRCINERRVIIAVKYRLYLDAQRNGEVNAVVAVFYEALSDKIAS